MLNMWGVLLTLSLSIINKYGQDVINWLLNLFKDNVYPKKKDFFKNLKHHIVEQLIDVSGI